MVVFAPGAIKIDPECLLINSLLLIHISFVSRKKHRKSPVEVSADVFGEVLSA